MRAQMRDAVARGVPGQLRRQLGRIIMGVPYILAPLDDRTAAVADQRRTAGTPAPAVIVVEAQHIFDVAPSPAHRTVGGGEERNGVMRTELGLSRKLEGANPSREKEG